MIILFLLCLPGKNPFIELVAVLCVVLPKRQSHHPRENITVRGSTKRFFVCLSVHHSQGIKKYYYLVSKM